MLLSAASSGGVRAVVRMVLVIVIDVDGVAAVVVTISSFVLRILANPFISNAHMHATRFCRSVLHNTQRQLRGARVAVAHYDGTNAGAAHPRQ